MTTVPPLLDAQQLQAHLDSRMTQLCREGSSMQTLQGQRHMAEEVVETIRQGRTRFVYMPVIHSETEDVLFDEMLLRLERLDGTPLPVQESFMALQRWDLMPIVMPYIVWQELVLAGSGTQKVSINIPPEMLNDPRGRDILDELLSNYTATTLLQSSLVLEITESALLQTHKNVAAFMEKHASMGICWALDDYGDGYHTLDHVKKLPIHVVKLGKQIVESLMFNQPQGMEDLFALTKERDLILVAEHTPTLSAAKKLRELYDIEYVQLTRDVKK